MRIDIHNHFIPPYFIEAARRGHGFDDTTIKAHNGQDWLYYPRLGHWHPLAVEFWDLEAKIQHMDTLGIDVSILSISPFLFFYWLEPGLAKEFCQRANEALAEYVSKSGGRLFGMATVPLQEPEAATVELRRAIQQLGLRGVHIGTSVEEIPLDDPRFDTFFATAAALGAPVMLHPYRLGSLQVKLADFYMTNLVGFPLATALAASRLILSGCLDRHPELKVILVHAGGFMPYQMGRLDHGFRVRTETTAKISSPPSSYLPRFYYDTITHASVPLKFLVELVGVEQIVFGTDIPFDMADLHFTEHLAAAGLDEQAIKAINGGNASRLFHLT